MMRVVVICKSVDSWEMVETVGHEPIGGSGSLKHAVKGYVPAPLLPNFWVLLCSMAMR